MCYYRQQTFSYAARGQVAKYTGFGKLSSLRAINQAGPKRLAARHIQGYSRKGDRCITARFEYGLIRHSEKARRGYLFLVRSSQNLESTDPSCTRGSPSTCPPVHPSAAHQRQKRALLM